MSVKIPPRLRYADGKPAWEGDKIRVTATGEDAFLRVVGVRGYVTVYHHTWPEARVCHVSEIEKR
jgi:hypothetical protein